MYVLAGKVSVKLSDSESALVAKLLKLYQVPKP